MVDPLDVLPVLLGWPAVVASVLAAALGLSQGRPAPLLVAALLVGPMSVYLAATPRFRWWGLFPVALYLVAAVAIRRNHKGLGAALVAVNAGFFWWLAFTVFG